MNFGKGVGRAGAGAGAAGPRRREESRTVVLACRPVSAIPVLTAQPQHHPTPPHGPRPMVAAHCALPLPAGSRVAWCWIRRLVDGVGEAGPSPEEALGRLVVCSTSTGTAAAFSLVSARQEKLSHPFFFRSVGWNTTSWTYYQPPMRRRHCHCRCGFGYSTPSWRTVLGYCTQRDRHQFCGRRRLLNLNL
jgi:hypothetical protein